MIWTGDKKTWVEGCDKLLSFMEKEVEKATKKNDVNKTKKLEKWRNAQELYKTEDDVNEAYGYEMITEKERKDLLELIETGRSKIDELNSTDAYVFLLKSFMSDLHQEKECFNGT